MFWFIKRRPKEEDVIESSQDASVHAQDVVEQAHKKAEKIIRETHFFTRKVEADLKKALEDTVAQVAKQSQEHMDSIVAKYKESLDNVAKTVEAAAVRELDAYGDQTKKNIDIAEQEISKALTKKKEAIEAALASEYDEKSARMVKALKEELLDVTQKMLGVGISFQDHERVVFERLAELKKTEPWK